jgi:hypothetical protein
MSISVKLTTAERREKTEQLLEDQKWKFQILKEESPLFIPKSAYIPRGKNEHYVSFFPSELTRKEDIYTEFVSYDLTPEDPDRTLYKLRANPFFDEEYEKTEDANFRYLVPVKELEKIVIGDPEFTENSEFAELDSIVSLKPKAQESENLSSDPTTEIKLSDITLKDFAAVMLKVPCSDKEWLNNLIKNS